jgi:hypothetical protein
VPGTRRRSVRVAVLSAALLICFGVSGADSAVQRPVAGVHQAYHGTQLHPPVSELKFKRYFFTGTESDQVNKLADAPTATFVADEPSGSTIMQNALPEADDDGEAPWNDPLTAYWSGPFTGEISGNILLNTYWSSLNPAHGILGPTVEASIWADPQPDGTARLIGRATLTGITGVQPQFNQHLVRANGTVSKTLVIQMRTIDDIYDEDMRVSYGSADQPSGFGIPVGPPPPRPKVVKNAPASDDGPRLELQAADIGTTAGEPTIGVHKDGTAFMEGGTFVVDLPPIVRGGFSPDLRRSRDGGVTWQSVQNRAPSGDPIPPGSLDPMLYVDPSTGRVFQPELYAACTYLNYSDDGGETWTNNPFACGMPVNDHQTLVAGPPPPGIETTGYPNVVYYCSALSLYSTCGRSLDGGDTFLPLPALPFPATDPLAGPGCGGPHGHVITDNDGRLFIPTGRCGYPVIAISEDGGESWTRVKISDVPAHDIQTSVAADTEGNLYYAWHGVDPKVPYLSVSTDHGRSWTPPRMIAPPGVVETNWPSVDAGTPGRIAITFPGSIHEGEEEEAASQPAAVEYAALVVPEQVTELGEGAREPQRLQTAPETRPWNLYVVVSTDALSADPLFVSATANPPSDPIHRGPCGEPVLGRCGLMFDFLDVVVAPSGEAWATAVDTCTDACVTDPDPDMSALEASNLGVAIRQIGGPKLREVKPVVGPPRENGPEPAPAKPPSKGLPVTGASATLVGLALVWAAFLLRVRFRR